MASPALVAIDMALTTVFRTLPLIRGNTPEAEIKAILSKAGRSAVRKIRAAKDGNDITIDDEAFNLLDYLVDEIDSEFDSPTPEPIEEPEPAAPQPPA